MTDLYNGKGVPLVDIPDMDAVGCLAVHRNVYGGESVGTLTAVHKDWCVLSEASGLIAVKNRRVPVATLFVLATDRDGQTVARNEWALRPLLQDDAAPVTQDAGKPKRRRVTKPDSP